MLAVHNSQGAARGPGLKGCPPHGPHVVDAVRKALRGPVDGVRAGGPGRQDGLEALHSTRDGTRVGVGPLIHPSAWVVHSSLYGVL